MSRKSSKDIKELVQIAGKKEAVRLLVQEGVSAHTAPKLVRNGYPSEVGILISEAIQRALSLARSKAS